MKHPSEQHFEDITDLSMRGHETEKAITLQVFQGSLHFEPHSLLF